MGINRRHFIKMGSLSVCSIPFLKFDNSDLLNGDKDLAFLSSAELFSSFKKADNKYRPFVRWWWNGDRLEKKEILRELDILKEAGIGGVEINPIRFPGNTDTLGIKSLEWLSDEWIAMLRTALVGAKERGIVCDMIVGSGWPYGGTFLKREDQIQMAALGARKISGGQTYQLTEKGLLDDVNPPVMSRNNDQEKQLLMVKAAPDKVNDFSDCVDVTHEFKDDVLTLTLPEGEYVLYYIVKLTGFMAVINGAPGAGGPVLNHYSQSAVSGYLNRMSDRLKKKIGPLGNYFRAFFTDSLELEGSNWCDDMFEQFKKRKHYDLKTYLPFILFKTGHMGNSIDEDYGADFSPEMEDLIERIRYDFEDVRVELFKERFLDTFVNWCHENGVQSRMQAYGRPCNPVEASMSLDIPECETWLGNGAGTSFSDNDYRRGRAYSMSNKFVSSGAHLADKQVISCEEMTNTGMVFNASLETLKIAGDQSIISGVTHSVLHGFNYSPLEAPFPGWIQYGTFFNERNTWWPFFKNWVDYKTRLYAVFQNTEMQADVAILPPLADLSGKFGFQRDPFPAIVYPKYVYQVWEAVHQCGNGCDYVTERIIQQGRIRKGRFEFNGRSYTTLILIDVTSLLPETAKALKKFTRTGGKLICIERSPDRSPGLRKNMGQQDTNIYLLKDADSKKVGIVPAPEKDFIHWYQQIQKRFDIKPYINIGAPDKYVSQVYYASDKQDFFFISNYNAQRDYSFKASFNMPVKREKAWIWDPTTGERFRIPRSGKNQEVQVSLGKSESKLIVFDDEPDEGEWFEEALLNPKEAISVNRPWKVHLRPLEGAPTSMVLENLVDFSEREDLKTFGGKAIYENTFDVPNPEQMRFLKLGKCFGVAEMEVNGQNVGLQWYGTPVHNISGLLKKGKNTIRIAVTFTLENYMKSLKDNAIAQAWVGYQPFHSMGLMGPVRLY